MRIPVSKSDLYYLSPCIGAIVTQVIFAKASRNIQFLIAGVGTLLPIAMKEGSPTSLFKRVTASLAAGLVIGSIATRLFKFRIALSILGVMDIFLAETLIAGICSSIKPDKKATWKTLADSLTKRGKESHSMDSIITEVTELLIRDREARNFFHGYFQKNSAEFNEINFGVSTALNAIFKTNKLPEIKWPKSE